MKFIAQIKTIAKELIVNRIIKGYTDTPTLANLISNFFLFDHNEYITYQNELHSKQTAGKIKK